MQGVYTGQLLTNLISKELNIVFSLSLWERSVNEQSWNSFPSFFFFFFCFFLVSLVGLSALVVLVGRLGHWSASEWPSKAVSMTNSTILSRQFAQCLHPSIPPSVPSSNCSTVHICIFLLRLCQRSCSSSFQVEFTILKWLQKLEKEK